MFAKRAISRRFFDLLNILLILSLLVGALAFPTDVSATNEATTRTSVDSNGNQANNESYWPDISSDGRYVTFFSWANNLVSGDTNNTNDVFVHDRQTGEIKVASISSAGDLGNMDSAASSISSDGRFVVFHSRSTNLVDNDANGQVYDIFLHDLETGETSIMSVDSNGVQANQYSSYPIISGNGRYVSFVSAAKNLVTNNSSNPLEIFVHDRETGITKQVSIASGGAFGNVSSFGAPKMSYDGRFILFTSPASNLVSGDVNEVRDIFMHDQTTDETVRVSVATNGIEANGVSGDYYDISYDGRFVVFYSSATNLVTDDTNGVPDIFVHDTQTGETSRISIDSSGMQSNGASYLPSISSDGRYIAFFSYGSYLVPNDNNGAADIFRHDRLTGETIRISLDTNGNEATSSGENADSDFPVISADGMVVAFVSYADNLVSNDSNNTRDIFVRSLASPPPPSTRYVATTGANTGDCGNVGSPCATITYAISQAVAGNTIEIFAGTYTEAGITVDKDLTITGAGATNTIVQASTFPNTALDRVFKINSDITVTIDSMTIQNGRCNAGMCDTYPGVGGGILNNGNLTVTNSTLSGNAATYAGGIFNNYGTLEIVNSTFYGNTATVESGGGVLNQEGTLTITNSTFSNNSARWGGAIVSEGMLNILNITNSTFSNNSASYGAGAMRTGGIAIIANSTFSGNNSIYAGGIYNIGYLTITNSTFSGNSGTSLIGGVYSTDTLNLYNTILANNIGADCLNGGNPITGGNNLIEATGSNACGLTNGIDGNITGIDPNLGVLADNGGTTQTMALLADSSAIDAGDDTVCAALPVVNLDQRGVIRPQGTNCDIGAYENDIPTMTDQTIAVNTHAPASAVYGSSFTVVATASSGLPVSYSSSGSCTNTGTDFTIISNTGDCIVMYDQAGDSTYNPAPQIIETVTDGTPPQVISIVRANPNPTSSTSVDFTVTFSESVTEVDVNDFIISTTGISGAFVSQVNGSGEVYTVSAETGTGNGTMRLDIVDDDSIIDSASNSLNNGFTTGEVYDVDKGNATPPSKPTLVSPANGSLSTDYTPLFDWNNSTLPVGTIFLHYQLQVATESTFTTIVFDVNLADINNSEFTPTSDFSSNTKFYWRVRAVNLFGNASAWSNVRNFDTALLPPTLTSPSNAEQLLGNRPTFNWEDVNGATGYRVEISSDSVNFTSPIVANVTASEYVRTSDLPAGQTLYWRVRSKGANGPSAWSEVWSITTANPPSAPILSTPTNNLKVSGPSPVFSWNDSTIPAGTDFDYYQIQIATENTFANIVHDNNVVDSQDITAVLSSGTTYYWRVRAFNTLGQASAWSNVRSVRIKFAGPTLTSPVSGVILDNLIPTFIWDAVSGATEYTIEVSKNSTLAGAKVINTTTLLPTYIHIANLQPNTTYYWHVRVKSPTTYGAGDWSQVFSFTTP